MSHSSLLKEIFNKKLEKENAYLIYSEEIRGNQITTIPIVIHNNYYDTIKEMVLLSIHKLYGRYIITERLLNILLSKKSYEIKLKHINREYQYLFDSRYSFQIKMRIIRKTDKEIKHKIANYSKIYANKKTIYNYRVFYEVCKEELKLTSQDFGDILDFMEDEYTYEAPPPVNPDKYKTAYRSHKCQ